MFLITGCWDDSEKSLVIFCYRRKEVQMKGKGNRYEEGGKSCERRENIRGPRGHQVAWSCGLMTETLT